MFRAEDYVKVDSLPEAYELCQKRSNLVVGGVVWLKMTSVTKRTIVNLSDPGLDKIEETKEGFRTGAMCILRQLETGQELDRYLGGVFKKCTYHIVGVQMHNLATVGGSIYSRFRLSDILTCLMAPDTYMELYHGGIVLLEEFAGRPTRRDGRDVLVRIIIKKDGRRAAYTIQGNSETGFPVIACCASRWGNDWRVTVGTGSGRAQVVKIRDDGYDSLTQLTGETADPFIYGSNTGAGRQHRRRLAVACTKHLTERLIGKSISKG